MPDRIRTLRGFQARSDRLFRETPGQFYRRVNPLEPRDQRNLRRSRRAWTNVGVAVGVQEISHVKQVFNVSLEPPLFTEVVEDCCVGTSVASENHSIVYRRKHIRTRYH